MRLLIVLLLIGAIVAQDILPTSHELLFSSCSSSGTRFVRDFTFSEEEVDACDCIEGKKHVSCALNVNANGPGVPKETHCVIQNSPSSPFTVHCSMRSGLSPVWKYNGLVQKKGQVFTYDIEGVPPPVVVIEVEETLTSMIPRQKNTWVFHTETDVTRMPLVTDVEQKDKIRLGSNDAVVMERCLIQKTSSLRRINDVDVYVYMEHGHEDHRPGLNVAHVMWRMDGDVVGKTTTTPLHVQTRSVGDHVLVGYLFDNTNAHSPVRMCSGILTIEEKVPNRAPNITCPRGPSEDGIFRVALGHSLELTVDAVDADGDELIIVWKNQDKDVIAMGTSSIVSFRKVGEEVVRVVASDGLMHRNCTIFVHVSPEVGSDASFRELCPGDQSVVAGGTLSLPAVRDLGDGVWECTVGCDDVHIRHTGVGTGYQRTWMRFKEAGQYRLIYDLADGRSCGVNVNASLSVVRVVCSPLVGHLGSGVGSLVSRAMFTVKDKREVEYGWVMGADVFGDRYSWYEKFVEEGNVPYISNRTLEVTTESVGHTNGFFVRWKGGVATCISKIDQL